MTPAAAAHVLVRTARRTLARRPCFAAALCGVAHADRFVAALARHASWPQLDRHRLHLFVLDSDWPAPWPAHEVLPVPVENLHRPRATLSRLDAALHYELLLRAHFSLRGGDVPAFDLVVVDGDVGGDEDDALQVTRLVVPGRNGRAVALSAAVIRAAARVVQIEPGTPGGAERPAQR